MLVYLVVLRCLDQVVAEVSIFQVMGSEVGVEMDILDRLDLVWDQ